MTLGETIKSFRAIHGLTQAQLSKKTGIPKTRLIAYENDKQPVRYEDLPPMAAEFNIEPTELTANCKALRMQAQPDKNLTEVLSELPLYNLNPFHAMSALETVAMANNLDIFSPDSTHFIPPLRHEENNPWVERVTDIGFLAAATSLAKQVSWPENSLAENIQSEMFEKIVVHASVVVGRDEFDSHVEPCGDMLRLYLLYQQAGITNNMGYFEIEERIQKVLTA